MNVTHHLDEATLLRFSAGDLADAFAVVAASHIAMCPHCRAAARLADEIGGNLLEAEVQPDQGAPAERAANSHDPAGRDPALSAFAFERLMHRIEADPATDAAGASPARPGDVPLPLRRLAGPSLSAVEWRRIAPGVRRHMIDAPRDGSSLFLLNISAGRAMPHHGHGGTEATLVLSGAYRDELGRFGPGDIADLDEQVVHRPQVEPGAPCICLVATEAPTRFRGLVPRLLAQIVRI